MNTTVKNTNIKNTTVKNTNIKNTNIKKILVRIFLVLFIISLLFWLIHSYLGFITLTGPRGGEIPFWMQPWSYLARAVFMTFTFQIYYILIMIGLIIEFFRPKIEWQWNGNKFLTLLAFIMILDSLVVIANNALNGFAGGWFDTEFYGLGFGILFLLTINKRTKGMRLALWTRLIEGGGLFIGYFFLPGLLSMWPSNAYVLDHVAHGPLFMFSSWYWWTDNLVALPSWLGSIYLLRKLGASRFWLTSFVIGSIIVGVSIAGYIIKTA